MSDSVSAQMMANAVRALSIDAVQKAKSGHPGMPMGMADIAVALWTRHLRHNPADPHWIGRDRFILSNGHGSMLQYSLLHLTGYDLSMDDIKNFRQMGNAFLINSFRYKSKISENHQSNAHKTSYKDSYL